MNAVTEFQPVSDRPESTERRVAGLLNAAGQLQANAERLGPQMKTLDLWRVVKINGAWTLVEAERSVESPQTAANVNPTAFGKAYNKPSPDIFVDFCTGGPAWTAARTKVVQESQLMWFEQTNPNAAEARTANQAAAIAFATRCGCPELTLLQVDQASTGVM